MDQARYPEANLDVERCMRLMNHMYLLSMMVWKIGNDGLIAYKTEHLWERSLYIYMITHYSNRHSFPHSSTLWLLETPYGHSLVSSAPANAAARLLRDQLLALTCHSCSAVPLYLLQPLPVAS